MTRTDEIIKGLRALLDELEALQGTQHSAQGKSSSKKLTTTDVADKYSGCMGGILYLIDNNFFDSPRSIKDVGDELKKEGWHYSGQLISMNLLGLTRRRKLTRLSEKGAKGWNYVIRK